MNALQSLGLKQLSLNDYSLLKAYYSTFKSNISDISLINLLLWKEKYKFHWTIDSGFLWIANVTDNAIYFSPPIGTYDELNAVIEAVDCMKARVESLKLPFVMKKVPKELAECFVNIAKIEANRDEHDYLYDFNAMKDLPGNAYHKKKNLVNQFYKKYPEHCFKLYSPNDYPLVKMFLEQWCTKRECENSFDLIVEYQGTLELLKNIEHLDTVKVGVLWMNETVVGLIMGEVLHQETLIVHIEKGDTQFTGVYQALGVMFYSVLASLGLKWVNREQDLGLEGLRQAKLSYHPEMLLEKFTVRYNQQI